MDYLFGFDSVLYAIPLRIRRAIEFLPDTIKKSTEEIRLRVGLPISLTIKGKSMFVAKSGNLSEFISRDLIFAEKEDIDEAFRLLCSNSVYAHTEEIKKGYIIMRSGHRAGICGTVIADGMRDISSINIRIAREILGCAKILAEKYDGGGILIAGPPGCGKTTVLRDVIRQLSNGILGVSHRIAVVDSRGELSGSYLGRCFTDLGANTDILLSEDKATASIMALRTMYPEILAFDEIGTATELNSVSECFNAGVSIITTAHIGSKADLTKRFVTNQLLKSGSISLIAVLPPKLSGKTEYFTAEEILNEFAF